MAWLIPGLIAGFVASKLMGGGYGIVGALIGGLVASLMFGGGVTGLNLDSIIWACILIAIQRAVSGDRARV